MIRAFRKEDLAAVMQIWLDANRKAHAFIPEEYWAPQYAAVEKQLPRAEVFVHEAEGTRQILGFIGLAGDYIAGLFVREDAGGAGVGTQLLHWAKGRRETLRLSVYRKNVRAVSFYRREQFTVQAEAVDADTHERELTMCWSRAPRP